MKAGLGRSVTELTGSILTPAPHLSVIGHETRVLANRGYPVVPSHAGEAFVALRRTGFSTWRTHCRPEGAGASLARGSGTRLDGSRAHLGSGFARSVAVDAR